MIHGSRKPSSGGIGTSCHSLTNSSPIHGFPSSQVFPTVANEDDGLRDFRDMEGPTMRELMETERVARMSREAAPAANA